MKKYRKYIISGILLFAALGNAQKTVAQSQELQQLILDIEKLTQLKSILSDMKTGYQIYREGYGSISQLSKGSFNLHSIYLNGLLSVSPPVRNYVRIADIISGQASLITEYKSAYRQFTQSGSFTPAELGYISDVYAQLVNQSLQNLTELAEVLTAGKMRMSDAERLKTIDRIYASSNDKLQFLRHFNQQGTLLSLQRLKESGDDRTLTRLYGINN